MDTQKDNQKQTDQVPLYVWIIIVLVAILFFWILVVSIYNQTRLVSAAVSGNPVAGQILQTQIIAGTAGEIAGDFTNRR